MPRKPQSHLCKTCSETDPANFHGIRKTECRKCVNAHYNASNRLNSASSKQAVKEEARIESLKRFTPVRKAQDSMTNEELTAKVNELTAKIHQLESRLDEQVKINIAIDKVALVHDSTIDAMTERLDRHSGYIIDINDRIDKIQPKPKSFTSFFV